MSRPRRWAPLRRLATLLAPLALSALAATGADAQTLIPEQGLDFGRLTPGVAVYVAPDDPDAASILVDGHHLSLRLVEPAPMTSAAGHTIPLTIGAGDAEVVSGGRTVALVPGVITDIRGRFQGTIHIGGTVTPAWNQPPGVYTSTLVIQIVAPGT